jgi:hypothetical protein
MRPPPVLGQSANKRRRFFFPAPPAVLWQQGRDEFHILKWVIGAAGRNYISTVRHKIGEKCLQESILQLETGGRILNVSAIFTQPIIGHHRMRPPWNILK